MTSGSADLPIRPNLRVGPVKSRCHTGRSSLSDVGNLGSPFGWPWKASGPSGSLGGLAAQGDDRLDVPAPE
jgi:hypothetical protein